MSCELCGFRVAGSMKGEDDLVINVVSGSRWGSRRVHGGWSDGGREVYKNVDT